MKIIVVFNSKTGFTEKYAQWIAAELSCPALPYSDLTPAVIDQYDVIIFGSRTFAGKIEHFNKIKYTLRNKTNIDLIVFATGATPSVAEDAVLKIWSDNLPGSEMESIPHFYMQGGLAYEKMKSLDRTLMKMAAKIMTGKGDKTGEQADAGYSLMDSHDISSKEFIAPLVDYMKTRYM